MKDIAGRNVLPTILFTIFIDLLGFGILLPVIPLLLAAPHSQYYLLPAGYTVKDGYIMLGFLTAIYPIFQFIATPILGQLSDKYGRKKLLAISLFGTCISYILFAIGILTRNIPLLFLARAFDGITGGNISVAQAAIADVTDPAHRARNFGLIGAAFGLGFIIGPYLGGKLSDPSVVSWFHAATPFWFAAILSFLNVLSIIFILPETLLHPRKDLLVHPAKSISNIIKAFSSEQLRVIFASAFLFQGGFTFFTTFFSVYLINKFAFTQGNIGDFFSFVGLWIVIAQAFVTRRVALKYREDQVLRVSLLAMALFVYVILLPNATWGLYALTPLFAVFNGLSMANLTALVSRSADARSQGEILGISASVQSLATAIPPILSGYIAASLAPHSPIIVSAIVIGLAGVMFIAFYRAPRVVTTEHSETPALAS